MKIKNVHLRNFRRLERVQIPFESEETVFVGPNNSGKTSATTAFQKFLIRQDFKIYDFSVSKIAELDAFGFADAADDIELPSIEMDMWFSIDPDIEFGRVFSLVLNASEDLDEVGIRISYCAKSAKDLKLAYQSAFPIPKGGGQQQSLSHYLSLSGNLNRHFGLCYFALETILDESIPTPIEPEEGKRVLQTLVRVDFVDAQRNIGDQEGGRSNRLSAAFATFYKKNLEQAKINEEANRVIDVNNADLTKHYDDHFKTLMKVIQSLGVPSVNDRQMKIVSTLNPEEALHGSTDLIYIDPALNHELPEAYNGLGFKNLVYMAIQVSHYHLQWMNTEKNRPLCQLIFIEEPEVHLHAQVQQTFISNIWKIVHKASKDAGEDRMVPQLGITTHSSHVLDAVEFGKVRYFQRCGREGEDQQAVVTLNASKVHSLRDFMPHKKSAAGVFEDKKETLDFLDRYLKLTHCDLFFADAAVLVEGTAEKLLLHKMIEKSAPTLKYSYLTVLEVGGAYAHRFASLLEFLDIPYLVITDIDSVDPNNNRKTCRADTQNAVTSNPSLKFFLNKETVGDLVNLQPKDQLLAEGNCCITFQKPTPVEGFKSAKSMHGRTFEETFVYQNMQLFRDDKIGIGKPIPDGLDYEQEYKTVFEQVKSDGFKKTAFALDVASSSSNWITPQYIADGLVWLESLIGQSVNEDDK